MKKIRNHFASSIVELFVLNDFDSHLSFCLLIDSLVNDRKFSGPDFSAHGKDVFNGPAFEIFQ